MNDTITKWLINHYIILLENKSIIFLPKLFILVQYYNRVIYRICIVFWCMRESKINIQYMTRFDSSPFYIIIIFSSSFWDRCFHQNEVVVVYCICKWGWDWHSTKLLTKASSPSCNPSKFCHNFNKNK